MLEIRILPGKGRAVVASTFIKKGAIIESAPAWHFSAKEREVIKRTGVFEVCFERVDEYHSGDLCSGYIVFGLSSLCNHSKEPNSYVEWVNKETGIWANLISLRNIEAGEEITLYYTNIDEYPNSSAFI
jgi:uncharacterized protein